MILQNWMSRMRGAARLEDLARQIAADCQDEVWRRVGRRIGAMSMAEARGYIRARAASVAHEHVDDLVEANSGVSPAKRDRLVSLILQTIVTETLRRTLREAPTQAPLRRAA